MKKIYLMVSIGLIFAALVLLPSVNTKMAHGDIHGLNSYPRTSELLPQNGSGTLIVTGSHRSRQIGMDILNRGGSAVDAALASALSWICLNMGQIVSFAGIYMMVYYEANTGKVHSLNACFKTPLEEHHPLTIPRSGIPNARAVQVPGFMAGVQAAHDRFGRLSRAEIFAPAIDIAENGFPLTSWMIDNIRNHWHVLGALPEGRKIFLKRNYGLFRNYEAGDIFKQEELAHTLRQVSHHGAEYMYTGEWGRKFVDITRRKGGHMTLRDLEEYDAVWADPAHTTYNGYDIYALGYPSLGAMNVVLAINLMECANLVSYDHPATSPDALYRLIYSSRVGEFFYAPYTPEILSTFIPEGNFSYASRHEKEVAQLIWDKIESGEWPQIEVRLAREGYRRPSHSEAIIAVDAVGNVAAVCHTINVDNWGGSGIFVDGVSIPGAGNFQQEWIDKVGPGAYLPDTTNPCLVVRDGLPAIASSCIGSDLHCISVQNLYNMLHFDVTMSESRDMPKFQSVSWNRNLRQKIQRGQFSQDLIDAVETMGLGIALVDSWPSEYWIGLRFPH
jgi:gamma-glutamyltranspeptidase/glutathione hydrolase